MKSGWGRETWKKRVLSSKWGQESGTNTEEILCLKKNLKIVSTTPDTTIRLNFWIPLELKNNIKNWRIKNRFINLDNFRGKHERSLVFRFCRLGKIWRTQHIVHMIRNVHMVQRPLLWCHWSKWCIGLNLTSEFLVPFFPLYVLQHLNPSPEYYQREVVSLL